ncbi:MAG: hypothetical protein ASUL_04094 [Candidatus Aramenus sulfurataquae]|jgi:Kef-type K+ transport system membrane component KefB|uniref:Cation:proton antiporter n=3 Tax=Candidatus Aramenus sulfurataquae TaxID=1326980 RepID=W7L7L9_9CREN|nr:MAG: hypothetical protein ASUL_04094 [Candidatus Aramenus sulfurataquae]MCL7344243.1 cation:proton antiporter [Candidatus Aramenus sulfurataquae]
MSVLVITLLYLGIMLILAKVAEEGFSRLGLIPFVGSIFLGILLGPGVTGAIQVNQIVSFISSLGIVLLLFLAGVEEISVDHDIPKNVIPASALQLVIPLVVVLLVVIRMGLPSPFVVLVPLIMTSAGPLTRLLIDLGIGKERVGTTLFYQATLVEIVSVVIFSIFLQSRGDLLPTTLEILGLIISIFAVGPFIAKFLEKVESYVKVREIEFASVISVILIVGFLADYLKFNSAISALFLGFLLRNYFKDRPDLLEKLRGFTYGFFEPLFFVSIGLYFVRLTPQLLLSSLVLMTAVISSKFLSGFMSSRLVNVDPILNGLGTSVKGGVDVSLLITALNAGAISSQEYSYSTLAISFSALLVPILFKLRGGFKVAKPSRARLNTRLKEVLNQIPLITVSCESYLREVIEKINERGLRGIVVVNNGRPMGVLSVSTLLEINPEDYGRLRACEVPLDEVVIVDEKARVLDVLRKFRETEAIVIAVMSNGKLRATVYERELFRLLSS